MKSVYYLRLRGVAVVQPDGGVCGHQDEPLTWSDVLPAAEELAARLVEIDLESRVAVVEIEAEPPVHARLAMALGCESVVQRQVREATDDTDD